MALRSTIRVAVATLAVAGLSACTPETTWTEIEGPWSVTTVDPAIANDPQVAADRQLLVDLYSGLSEAWDDGLASAIEYELRWNHPSEGTEEECRKVWEEVRIHGVPDGYREEIEILEETFHPVPGWVLPRKEIVPEGRLYEYMVNAQRRVDDEELLRDTITVHGAILNGEAYFFLRCDRLP